jgi:hypothetical protein
MTTVDEIVAAAQRLDADQFLRLRRKLDRLERKLWDAEHDRVTAAMKKARIGDKEIDGLVMKRRR